MPRTAPPHSPTIPSFWFQRQKYLWFLFLLVSLTYRFPLSSLSISSLSPRPPSAILRAHPTALRAAVPPLVTICRLARHPHPPIPPALRQKPRPPLSRPRLLLLTPPPTPQPLDLPPAQFPAVRAPQQCRRSPACTPPTTPPAPSRPTTSALAISPLPASTTGCLLHVPHLLLSPTPPVAVPSSPYLRAPVFSSNPCAASLSVVEPIDASSWLRVRLLILQPF